MSCDEKKIVPYLVNVKQDNDLAKRLAERCNLPGGEELFAQNSKEKLVQDRYSKSENIAAKVSKVCMCFSNSSISNNDL